MDVDRQLADLELATELLAWRDIVHRRRLNGRGLLRGLRREHTRGRESPGILFVLAKHMPDAPARAWVKVLFDMATELRDGTRTGHEGT